MRKKYEMSVKGIGERGRAEGTGREERKKE
jgi:hypothetical protein